MNFYNFFDVLSSENEERFWLSSMIEKLLVNEENEYYSNGFQPLETQQNDPQFNFELGDRLQLLNPSMFDTNSPTLPIVHYLPAANGPSYYHRGHSPWKTFLNLFNSSDRNHSQTTNDIRALYHTLYSSHTLSNRFKFNRHTPNQFFQETWKVLEATSSKMNSYSLNPEIHTKLLQNGYVCFISNAEETTQISGSRENVSPIIALAELYASFYEYIIHKKLIAETGNQDLETLNTSYPAAYSLWQQLNDTDAHTNFLHIDFYRPTQQLLLLSTEELQHRIDLLKTIQVHNYVKTGFLEEKDSVKIYSSFSSAFYNKFKTIARTGFSDTLNDDNIIKIVNTKPYDFQCLPSSSHEYNYEFNSMFSYGNNSGRGSSVTNHLPGNNNSTPALYIGGSSGFIFKHHANNDHRFTFKESLTQNENSRAVGLISNGFTKTTSKQDFDFINLTKKQTLIRKGFFAPVLVPFLIKDSDMQNKLAYSFSLYNPTSTLDEVKKKKRSRQELKSFCSKYGADGLIFANYEQYIKRHLERMKDLAEYSSVNSPSFSNCSSTVLDTLITSIPNVKQKLKTATPTSLCNFSDSLTSKLALNPSILKKYNKVNNHYSKLINQNKVERDIITNNAITVSTKQNDIRSAREAIQTYMDSIAAFEIEIVNHAKNLKSAFNKRMDLLKTILTNATLHSTIKSKYDQEVEAAIKSSSYKNGTFFKNLYEKESIEILELSARLNHLGTQGKLKTLNYQSDPRELSEFAKSLLTQKTDLILEEVMFLIDKPVIINVDGGNKGQRVAGPYIVKVKKNSLHIALAYPSSIHGYDTSGTIYTHPHCSSNSTNGFFNGFGNVTDYKSYPFRNACLGEASALLYKAFENNNLKTIIIAALTWVKNANSTDVWGKTYSKFPTYENFLNSPAASVEGTKIETTQITDDEVEEFLVEMIETQEAPAVNTADALHEQTTEETVAQSPMLQEGPVLEETPTLETNTNVNATDTITDFNTNQPYIPYALR